MSFPHDASPPFGATPKKAELEIWDYEQETWCAYGHHTHGEMVDAACDYENAFGRQPPDFEDAVEKVWARLQNLDDPNPEAPMEFCLPADTGAEAFTVLWGA